MMYCIGMIFLKTLKMKLIYIQLPHGVVNNRVKKKKKNHLNLPSNYEKHILFDQLPYLAHLENPTIRDVNNGINNKETLQKYLLATGILESSIQDSLDMIIGDDGKLSNAAFCREPNLKIPNVMKKPNPVEYIFKNIAKFDSQNPIVGDIIKQTQKVH